MAAAEPESPQPAAAELTVAADEIAQPTYRIECGDGPSLLLAFGDVDHVFADVPYSKDVEENNDAEKLRSNPFEFEAMTPDLCERTCAAIAARCKRWAIIMTDEEEGAPMFRANLKRAGMNVVRSGIWVRQGGKPQMSGDRPSQGHEVIIIAHSRIGEMRWNGGGKPAVYYAPIVHGDQRVHPTQKPDKLLRELIEDFSDPGDTWADPFGGSFTTGRVALGLGRNFFGVDLKQYYVDLAHQTMSVPLFHNAPLQSDMFSTPSPASRATRARDELDRQILRLIRDSNGITRGLITETITATRHEITSSLGRLRKKGLIARNGTTSDCRYTMAVAMQGTPLFSTGDPQT